MWRRSDASTFEDGDGREISKMSEVRSCEEGATVWVESVDDRIKKEVIGAAWKGA